MFSHFSEYLYHENTTWSNFKIFILFNVYKYEIPCQFTMNEFGFESLLD